MLAALLAGGVGGPAFGAVLWNFTNGTDGEGSQGELYADGTGVLYGTTTAGGVKANGVVFRLAPNPPLTTPAATLETLYMFNGQADGSLPNGSLIGDGAGGLLGTAALDGAHGGGVVFRLAPSAAAGSPWIETPLWSFGGAGDGATPQGGLVRDAAGALYGTTLVGGSSQAGVVFRLSPPAGGQTAWTETLLWQFSGGADGGRPGGTLTLAPDGSFYGTTQSGGAGGGGTVFRLSNGAGGWSLATLHSFAGPDGASPTPSVVFGTDGALYGATRFGGSDGVSGTACGQARFAYYNDPDSQYVPARGADYIPPGGNQCGTVFRLTPPAAGSAAWGFQTLKLLQGNADGANPIGAPLVRANGAVYTTFSAYGKTFWGGVLRLSPPVSGGASWVSNNIINFTGKTVGFYGRSGLVPGPYGLLYATTPVGGPYWEHVTNYGYGMVYSSKP